MDPWKRGGDRTNSNFCVMGNSGVGKSTAVKHILLSEYIRGTKIIVIDPESEYKEMCQKLSGDWISATGGFKGRLNPLQVLPSPRDDEEEPEENRLYLSLIHIYIEKYIEQKRVCVEDIDRSELCELLYGEMTGFSFLTKYLNRDDVEEININQWKDVKITYSSGEILPAKEQFNSPGHAVDVIRRLLHKSCLLYTSHYFAPVV